jgi:hypothetical protein
MVRGIIQGAEGFGKPQEGRRGQARELLFEGKLNGNAARMLVLEQDDALATVLVTYAPEAQVDAEAVLASVRFDAQAPLDPLAIHSLSLTTHGGLQVLDTTHQPIVLRDPRVPTPVPSTEPVAFLSVLPHNKGEGISDEDLGRLLGSLIVRLNPDLESAKAAPFELAGSQAIQMALEGEKDGERVAVYCYALRDGDTALFAVGHVAKSVADEKMPALVETLRSLQLRDYR